MDVIGKSQHSSSHRDESDVRSSNHERRGISKADRSEIEDKLIGSQDENDELKKHIRQQDDKIKRLGTKLLRLVNDKKKQDSDVSGRKRDVELEEIIQDLQDQNRELCKENKHIKEKLIVVKQQLATRSRKPSPYNYVASRIDSGRAKTNQDRTSPSYKDARGSTPAFRGGAASPLPKYGLNLLEEARTEIRHLEETVQTLKEQLYIYEQEMETIREQLKVRDANHADEVTTLKSQMTMGERKNIQGNVDLIRFQRELKQKSTKLLSVEEEKQRLQNTMDALKVSNQELLSSVEHLNKQLQEQQKTNIKIDTEIRKGTSLERTLQQYQEQLADIKRENSILKESNDKLMNSISEVQQVKRNNPVEETLRNHVRKLESMLLNANVVDTSSTTSYDRHDAVQEIIAVSHQPVHRSIDRPDDDRYQKLRLEHDVLSKSFKRLKEENEEMNEKLKILSESSTVNLADLEQALLNVKLAKESEIKCGNGDQSEQDSLFKQLKMLEAQHIETVNELEKTRNMLILQHRINRDYQVEIDTVNRQKNQSQTEFETRLQEYAQLLDIRAARIHKLERQLKDIAYGTKQYQLNEDVMSDDESEETIELERGQNLFELHIDKVTLSPECMHLLQDGEPCTFLTWAFYDFEFVTTSVVKGKSPEFGHTARYVIRVDDCFLKYLTKEKTRVELHVALGMDYKTVAVCNVDHRPLLDNTQTRYHGRAQFYGSVEGYENVIMGTLDFWSRLKIPMEQAVRLFKERGKALGYIAINHHSTKSALSILDAERPELKTDDDLTNELHIKIVRCSGLISSHRPNDDQPSPFCVYSFYDTPDHDTAIVQSSNDPEFNDHRTVSVVLNSDLDSYLRTKSLDVYVFDDNDPEIGRNVGVASIPLVSLVRDNAIKGTFEVFKDDDEDGRRVYGYIDVSIYWQYSYMIGCKDGAVVQSQVSDVVKEKEFVESEHQTPTKSDKFEDEKSNFDDDRRLSGTIVAGDSATISRPVPRPRTASASGPSAISTPVASRKRSIRDDKFAKLSDSEDEAEKLKPEVTPRRSSTMMEPIPIPVHEEARTPSVDLAKNATPASPAKKLDLSPEKKSVASVDLTEDKDFPSPTQSQNGDPPTPSGCNATQKLIPDGSHELSDDESVDSTKDDLCENSQGSGKSSEDEESLDSRRSSKSVAEVKKPSTGSTSESEDIVVNSSPKLKSTSRASDKVTIVVHHLTLVDGSNIVSDDDDVNMLFVEYKFLDVTAEELETPFALPKPKPGTKIAFHFHKVFRVDAKNNYTRRQILAAMILPESSGIVKFTVVSEPPEDRQEEVECEDVGYATVDLKKILESRIDITETDVEIYDVDGKNVIGHLNVTVEAVATLDAIRSEIQNA